MTDTYESTPNSGGYYHVNATYWPSGLMNTSNPNITGLPTWTYTPDGEGRVNGVSANSGQNPVLSTTYNGLSEPRIVTLGSGDSDTLTYDGNTGRMTQYEASISSSNVIGNLTWNPNGTLQTLNITDPFTPGNQQNCTYVYDDLTRLASVTCPSVWSQTFGYDAFGNIGKSGSVSFAPLYNQSTNQYQTLPVGTPSCDANGNLLTDGFHT